MLKRAGQRLVLLFVLGGTILLSVGARAGELVRRIARDEGAGAALLIRARDFTPGDIMLLTLENASDLREADVVWRGRAYKLETARNGGNPLAFIGIDFTLKPGTYPLRVTFVDRAGRARERADSIEIRPRVFRLRRLVLDEKFVVAPPEQLERIRREAEMVAAVYRETSPDWLGDGFFELPHEGLMYPNFGDRRTYNGRPGQSHSGVDISAEMGDPILASNAGRVVLAADLYFSGNTVIMDHGLGIFTSYFHMSRLRVRTGEVVPKGRVLGEAGSTGRSTGPHLHWGVRIFDSRVDPRALLRLPLLDWEKGAQPSPPSRTKDDTETVPSTSSKPAVDAPSRSTRTTSPPASAEPRTKAAKTAGLSVESYYIQLAAFELKESADIFASRVRAAGYSTLVVGPWPTDKRPSYRVRVGGYPTRGDAEKDVARLRVTVTWRKFEYWIVRD